jgi:Tol biopolymer transport system component
MAKKLTYTHAHSQPIPSTVSGQTISGVSPLNSPVKLVSTNATGESANLLSWDPAFSPDGTKIAFTSIANNLTPNDVNGLPDLFIKDLVTGAVTLVSQPSFGASTNYNENSLVFSPDGSKIAYADGSNRVFLKDLVTGTDTLLSSNAAGDAPNGSSYYPTFSPDGSKIAFFSFANNLVPSDYDGALDLFIKDLASGTLTRVSLNDHNSPFPQSSQIGQLTFSPDGTKIAFSSESGGLAIGDNNRAMDVFVLEIATGIISLVSTAMSGGSGNDYSLSPVFTPDGNNISFRSSATDLVIGDAPYTQDVFTKNLTTGVITISSTDSLGQPISGYMQNFSYSPDGKTAVFVSSGGLVPGTEGQSIVIYLKDLATGALSAVPGAYADGYINGGNWGPSFSADSSSIVFHAYAQYITNGISSDSSGIFTYKIGGTVVPAGETITGGAGIDTATYETSQSAVTIDLNHTDDIANLGDALKDTYISIENFKLTNYDDTFIGLNARGAKNSASGLDGADTFVSGGKGTTNTFDGGNGADIFKGGAGTDKLIGGAGDDIFTGGGGKDVMIGGTGADTFIFNLKEKGTETITDFELGVDHLQFNGFSARNVSVHMEHGHIQIEIDHGATIILDNITDINALKNDMLFV